MLGRVTKEIRFNFKSYRTLKALTLEKRVQTLSTPKGRGKFQYKVILRTQGHSCTIYKTEAIQIRS